MKKMGLHKTGKQYTLLKNCSLLVATFCQNYQVINSLTLMKQFLKIKLLASTPATQLQIPQQWNVVRFIRITLITSKYVQLVPELVRNHNVTKFNHATHSFGRRAYLHLFSHLCGVGLCATSDREKKWMEFYKKTAKRLIMTNITEKQISVAV